MRYTIVSDIGRKRALNEDCAAFISRADSYQLAIVADGMGGHNAGDVASKMAVKQLEEYFIEADSASFETTLKTEDWLKKTVKSINSSLYKYSLTHEGCQGMGTTLIAVVFKDTNAVISHVGDSRVYLISSEEVRLITKDHSYVNILVDNGEISEEEAKSHPKKNYILKSLGTESTIEPDSYQVEMIDDTYMLICSDGLSNKLTNEEMQTIVTNTSTLEEKGDELVQLANDLGGEDNITLILLSQSHEEV
ncbi:Stp1/IreP family PP2C-type Ser/Thr phosphatase [Rummeliibacillus stabekisii]|uniref:protein-serine/threonine phosphatase n=1 Tax=Rummeliibacillus stabekisii TaxID=241244 RepID=A0A143H9H7_9BACL|nr:Stp1/IreP family PP2C-type Ser/Thr phosphatase [Rummeliibacillus stabekisii]AMW98378.1 protein phosphatase [Rummeliibacillus stabekisii]